MLATSFAVLFVFFVSDLIYTLDHYFVHHDRKRYVLTHVRHHRRYVRAKHAAQLDRYELSTYTSAAVMSVAGFSVVSLFSGNPGFLIGTLLKYAHSLLLHLYQHRWWSQTPIRKRQAGKPRRSWGLVSAHYHSFHHSHPTDLVFTFAESWAGFDRILEWAHPWLLRHTVDGKDQRRDSGLPEVGDTSELDFIDSAALEAQTTTVRRNKQSERAAEVRR